MSTLEFTPICEQIRTGRWPASSLIFFGTHKMDRTSLHAKMKSVWNTETKLGELMARS